jgi:hypothetical protein
LASVLPCGQAPAAEAEQSKCAQDFIQKFGLRAFRRPLTSEETTAYVGLYTQQRTEVKHDFVNAIRVVMTALMLSPNFIYRWETATQTIKRDGKYLRFNSYELASRLSYMVYASMPDEGLFTAAAGDKLSSPDQIEQEVRRMLKDPKAKDGFGDFIHQWLVVSDLPDQRKGQQYTVYTPAVPGALLAEARDSLAAVMGGDGKLATLFTMKPSSANADVAKIYQVGGAKAVRAGILTQGAFLASHAKADETHPVGRGNTIAERVLCKDLPPPPDDIPQPKDPAPNLSTRERFEDHSTNPCARSCHSIIDPLGFAFENYDAISAWRDTDGGKPVNSADQLELDGKVQKFTNGVELSALISTSKEAGDCLARQWLRYTLRRKEISGDAASLLTAREAFTKSGFDMRELLVALSRTASFTHRTASTGELLP